MTEQRTDEWFVERLGKVTASRVADIVANGRGKQESARRRNYRAELMAERMAGKPLDNFLTNSMDWGVITEDEARAAYEFMFDVSVELVGFVPHPDIEMAGASPDGLVGEDGLVEFKCPNTRTQIVALAEHYDFIQGKGFDPEYVTQMQWQMACTGRQWCDFCSYDPRLPHPYNFHAHRIERDNERIEELTDAVLEFLAEVDATEAAIRAAHEIELEAA